MISLPLIVLLKLDFGFPHLLKSISHRTIHGTHQSAILRFLWNCDIILKESIIVRAVKKEQFYKI